MEQRKGKSGRAEEGLHSLELLPCASVILRLHGTGRVVDAEYSLEGVESVEKAK